MALRLNTPDTQAQSTHNTRAHTHARHRHTREKKPDYVPHLAEARDERPRRAPVGAIAELMLGQGRLGPARDLPTTPGGRAQITSDAGARERAGVTTNGVHAFDARQSKSKQRQSERGGQEQQCFDGLLYIIEQSQQGQSHPRERH